MDDSKLKTLKIEIALRTDDPYALADSMNSLFQFLKARYTIYDKGICVDNMAQYCINCTPNEVGK